MKRRLYLLDYLNRKPVGHLISSKSEIPHPKSESPMPPVTFYPGPSKVYPQVAAYMQDAYNEGILSINHRSTECMNIVKSVVALLQEKLGVPADYSVFFV